MTINLQGELTIMDSLNIKPNYAALGREYGMDWRTVKKYHEGYRGKPKSRDKPSKLDVYKEEIADKLKIKRITVKATYEFMVTKYGIDEIGSYSNFIAFVKKNKLKPNSKVTGHPRVETLAGEQAQVDWKEEITMVSKYGEIFVVNIFHIVLSFSRFNYLELSLQRRSEDVHRCLINGFQAFGGVPAEILFDNMSTVANTHTKPKKPTESISRFAKEFGFKVRLCAARSPQTKGTVEAKNKVLDWIRAYEGEFENLEDLITIVGEINKKMNITVNQETHMSPTALFYKEKEYLQPLPAQEIIDYYLQPNSYIVSNESLIRYNGSKYSVDPRLINEKVTVDVLDNKLYIYYNGKFETYHQLNEKPVNYKTEHYESLMKGKVKDTDMSERIEHNLKIMDALLEERKIQVSSVEATKSADALITYLNQNAYGKWIINHYAHLPASDQLLFVRGMNQVLPYVKNKDVFFNRIKYSMKKNLCRTIDFDCYINDLMAFSEADSILTDEGYHAIGEKYNTEIQAFIDEMRQQHADDHKDSEAELYDDTHKTLMGTGVNVPDEEMPFQ